MSPESITIQLDDTRRKLGAWWQKAQHVVGGLPLLLAGVDRFQRSAGVGRALALAEIMVAGALLVIFARDIRKAVRARITGANADPHASVHAGPEWFDVAAGILLIIEAVLSTHPGGKPLYEHAILYLGAVTLLTGLAHGPLSGLSWKRRFVRIDSAGIHARLSPFRNFNVLWADIVDIQLSERSVIVMTKRETHTIALGRYGNGTEVRAALGGWRERKALVVQG